MSAEPKKPHAGKLVCLIAFAVLTGLAFYTSSFDLKLSACELAFGAFFWGLFIGMGIA